MIKRFGNAPVKNQDYRLRPGAYAILPRAEKLLVTYQAGNFNELQLPGGGIDPGETAIQALHREVFEETGWHVTSPRKLGVFRRFVYMPDYDIHAEKICHIFIARPTLQIGPPPEPDHTPIWISPEIASEALANEGDRYFVNQLIG